MRPAVPIALVMVAGACAHARVTPPPPVTTAPPPARVDTAAEDRVPPFRAQPLVPAWGAEPEGTVHALAPHGYDLRHQVVHVRFDWSRHAVVGTTSVTVAALDAPLTAVALHAESMMIGRVTGTGGRALAHQYDGHVLTVRPPAPVAVHGTFGFDVAYEAVRPRKGAYFIDRAHVLWTQGEAEDTRYWVPTYDHPDDKETWEFYITAPANERALSNGRLAGQRRVPGGIEWHWVLDHPASTYLMSAATGNLAVVPDRWEDVPVNYWTYPDSVAAARRGFGMTPQAIGIFSTRTGVRYPWNKYDQLTAPDFIFGGMENVTATTQDDEEILHPAVAEPQAYSGGLVAHELGHQWYGDLLTTRTWADAWLNEGFATFMEQTFTEDARGKEEADLERREARAQVVGADLRGRRPIVYDRFVTDPLELFFSGHIYPKGATILQMLRHQLGDSLFWAAMHRYTVDHAYDTVVSADLERAFEQTTGRDYTQFFRDWVYKAGFPVFQVSYAYEPGARRLTLQAHEVQPRDSLTGNFDVDVDVAVLTDAGRLAARLPVRGGAGSVTLTSGDAPRAILWDPDGWLLQETDFPRSTRMLAYQLAHAPETNARLEAVERLADRSGQPDAGAAAAALAMAARADRFWAVRRDAATVLGAFNEPATADTARAAVLAASRDSDARVREAAASPLALLVVPGHNEGGERLRELVQSDPSPFVRGAAIQAFTTVDPQAALPLIESLLAQPSWGDLLRINALQALLPVQPDRSVPLLEAALAPTTSRFTRTVAITTLARVATTHGLQGQVAPRLEPLLNDPDIFLRGAAATALGQLGQASAIPALEARRKVELDGRVVTAIDQALARLRGRPSS